MIILTPDQFKERKTSDTLVIYGCGYSINEIKTKQLAKLQKFDSIGFNWFCKSGLHTTFYMVREQANVKKRVKKGETVKGLFRYMASDPYKSSCRIVVNIIKDGWPDKIKKTVFPYHEHLEQLGGSGVVLKEIRKLGHPSIFKKTDIFDKGNYHGRCTMCNIMHIVSYLRYRRIIFAGIDLYDSRYFWLKKNETRASVRGKGQSYKSKHAISKDLIELIRRFKRTHKVRLLTQNPKSLLTKIMGVWE